MVCNELVLLSICVICSKNSKFVLFAVKEFSLSNCVAYNELVSLSIRVICSEEIFATELCCQQRISFVAEGVVYSKLVSMSRVLSIVS